MDSAVICTITATYQSSLIIKHTNDTRIFFIIINTALFDPRSVFE